MLSLSRDLPVPLYHQVKTSILSRIEIDHRPAPWHHGQRDAVARRLGLERQDRVADQGGDVGRLALEAKRAGIGQRQRPQILDPVSYTHLTLPTILRV